MYAMGLGACLLLTDASVRVEIQRQAIAPVIRALRDDSFSVRQQAMRDLLHVERERISDVIRFVRVDEPETIARITTLLRALARSTEPAELVESLGMLQFRRATASTTTEQQVLDSLLVLLESMASEAIRDGGGKVATESTQSGAKRMKVTFYRLDAGARVNYLKFWPRLHLELSGPAIDDSRVEFLSGMQNLEVLDARYTLVGSRCAAAISKCRRLESIYLSRTRISDADLSHLLTLRNLTSLFLTDTALTDASVPTLVRMQGLRRLSVRGTEISERGFARLREELPQCEIQR